MSFKLKIWVEMSESGNVWCDDSPLPVSSDEDGGHDEEYEVIKDIVVWASNPIMDMRKTFIKVQISFGLNHRFEILYKKNESSSPNGGYNVPFQKKVKWSENGEVDLLTVEGGGREMWRRIPIVIS